MAAQVNVPTQDITKYHAVKNTSVSTISKYLMLVPDGTNVHGATVPATSSTPTSWVGVACEDIAASAYGSVARIGGDIVVVKAGTGGVAVGNRIIIDTASGKEGRGTAYSSGTRLMVGVARTAADDGDLFEMQILVQTIAA